MTPLEFIRKTVFGVSQQKFAGLVHVSQSTVSRWEKGELEPSLSEMSAIRSLAGDQKIEWSDGWFFAVPDAEPEPQAAA